MKKGFTLVELLAVIIILGVLVLITVPTVTKIISSSKKNIGEEGVRNYVKAVGNAILLNETKGLIIEDGTYPIDQYGNICLGEFTNKACTDEKKLEIDIDGERPILGIITIKNGKVVEVNNLEYNKYIGFYKDGDVNCEIDKNKIEEKGDVNNDKVVNKQDVIDLSYYLYRNTTINSPKNGDMNNDGTITYDDINILSLKLGYVTSTSGEVGILGDVNGNGLIESNQSLDSGTADYILIMKYSAGETINGNFVLVNGDVNGDGQVSGLDSVIMLQVIEKTIVKQVTVN